ncbi:MAG: SurA N-terminal domain-containing protein [Sulfuricaulis sp.]
MLSQIREKTQGIIATFILLLIVIPFALWGINSYFDNGSNINVAKVGDVYISQATYRNAMDRLRGRVDPTAFNTPQFKKLVLDNLIDQTLLAQDARKQGYRISDAWLAQAIRSLPYFQQNGHFDVAQYQAALQREGMSPHEYETQLRTVGLTSQIQTGLSESGFVTDADIDDVARLMAQQREVAYGVISSAALAAKTTVSEQQVDQYYSSHVDMFQTPEQVRIQYLLLSAGDLDKDYQPTEEELKKAYSEESGRYVTPETRRASHILIALPAHATGTQVKDALTKIEGIAKLARAGADFAKLAKKYSADSATAAHGGDLGEVHRGELPKEVEAAVYALKPGEISKPIRSAYGYHLVKLTAYTPSKQKSFVAVRKDLVDLLRRRKGEDKFTDVSEKFRDLVYEQPDSLAPAAKALGLEIQKSDWFTRDGGSGIAANPKVAQAAFDPDVLSEALNSDPIDNNDDTLVSIRVTDRRPAGRKPLTEVRAQIEQILKQQQAQDQAHELGEKWLHELLAGASLESLAKQYGFKYLPAQEITRQQTTGVDPRITEAAFRSPRPQPNKPVYDLVDLGGQGYAVLALVRVQDPSGKIDNDVLEKARTLLSTRRGPDYFADYRAGLREQEKIKIYSEQL